MNYTAAVLFFLVSAVFLPQAAHAQTDCSRKLSPILADWAKYDWYIKEKYWLKDDAREISAAFGISADTALVLLAELHLGSVDTYVDSFRHAGMAKSWSVPAIFAVAQGLVQATGETPFLRLSKTIDGVRRWILALNEPRILSGASLKLAVIALGYNNKIAENIARLYPDLAVDILAIAKVDPSSAAPQVLYNRIALRDGIAGYKMILDQNRWFTRGYSDDEPSSMNGGRTGTEDWPTVVVEAQYPNFALSKGQSGMQSGLFFPVITPQLMPDPSAPDLSPFVLRIGIRAPGEQVTRFEEFFYKRGGK